MSDSFNDIGYAFIEIYVGMAKMVAYWHVKAMGFELKGYRGPETGVDDVVSFLLNKKDINLVITSAANPGNYDVVSFVDRHGNGVKRIACSVPMACTSTKWNIGSSISSTFSAVTSTRNSSRVIWPRNIPASCSN